MQQVILMRGLPGSGKSTRAREFIEGQGDWVRVSRDDIRFMINNKWSPELEKVVKETKLSLLRSALNSGFNVIIDECHTNLKKSDYDWIKEKYGADIKVWDVKTDVQECLQRNKERTGREHVREEDIIKKNEKFDWSPIIW